MLPVHTDTWAISRCSRQREGPAQTYYNDVLNGQETGKRQSGGVLVC